MNSYIQNGIDNAEFLCHLGIPHVLKISSGAARIEPQGGKPMVFTSGEISKKHLWFFRYVKTEVQKSPAFWSNEAYLKGLSSQSVNYILDGGRQPGTYAGLTEIDLNGAYWTAAYLLGYISKECYQKGFERDKKGELKIPKHIRLVALGALARRRTVREFVPGQGYELKPLEYDPHQGGVFFDCAKLIGEVMVKCVAAIHNAGIKRNPFMFFWFDALFVRQELAPLVAKFFLQHGFASKQIEIEKAVIEHGKNGRVVTVHETRGRIKPFSLSINFECKIAFESFVAEIKNNKKWI